MKLLGRGTTAKSTTPQRGCLVGGGTLTVSKVARGDAVTIKFTTSVPATSYRTELATELNCRTSNCTCRKEHQLCTCNLIINFA